MARSSLALGMTLLALGCGGSDKPAPPPFQCPAPQAPSGSLTGTLATVAFTPAEMGGLTLGPVTCQVAPGVNAQLAALVLGFSSFQGLCPPLLQYGICWDKANATLASVQIVNIGVGAAPSVPGPGTYTIPGTATQPVGVSYGRTGAACASLGAGDATAGTVTISTVTSTQVTGSLTGVTFADGSTLSGSFTAAVVGVPLNLCQFVAGCGTTTCLP
ncbi:MAG TPA: hypothetical protein VFF02_15610 [Anaeromyxobacteraceae bacterium]|nr:hypothetical protein [Anaeromyxobacteraceae bacterium]